MGFGGDFGISFTMFNSMFLLVFVFVIGTFVFAIVSNLCRWNHNNHSPRLTVEARVVAKRTSVSHHHHGTAGDADYHTSTNTTYYVTFQVQSGDRMELMMRGSEYGMLAEGDVGMLTFQGTRYLEFVRR